MNKVFIKKMMQAKKLQCEAIKEIMPDGLKDRIEAFEKEGFDLLKEVAMEMFSESGFGENVKEHSQEAQKSSSKKTKKVNVDFN